MLDRLLFGFVLISAFAAYGQEPPAVPAIRVYAEGYLRGLPDYTCNQKTKRTSAGAQLRNARVDTFEEELSFVDGAEHYKVLKVNGAPASNVTHEQLGGTISSGEFGGLLRQIFAPQSLTAFRPQSSGKLHGRMMIMLPFRVPQQTGYALSDGERHQQFRVAYEGTVWADPESKAVMRIEMKLVNLPKETRMTSSSVTLEYKPVMLSGQAFVLPAQFTWDWQKRQGSGQPAETGTNSIEFTSCRKFTTESNISFDN